MTYYFDMDGVLLDTEKLGSQILPVIIEELGYNCPEDLYFRVLGANRQVSNQIYYGLFGNDFPGDYADKLFFDRMLEIARRGEKFYFLHMDILANAHACTCAVYFFVRIKSPSSSSKKRKVISLSSCAVWIKVRRERIMAPCLVR